MMILDKRFRYLGGKIKRGESYYIKGVSPL